MKIASILAAFVILPSGIWGGHLPECSEFNVTDVESCEAWCGGEGMGVIEVVAGHADTTEGLHVDVLEGMECHCEEHGDMMMHDMNMADMNMADMNMTDMNMTVDTNATVAPMNGTVAPTNETATEEPTEGSATEAPNDDPKACWIGHSPFPTCAEKGLGECEEGAEMSCADLCASIPGVVGAEVHRFLEAHVEHVCKRVEGAAIHESADGEVHDSHDENNYPDYTICLCNAEESGDGLMVCADDGWRCKSEGACDGDDEGLDASDDPSGANAIRLVVSTALAFFVALI